MSLDDVVACIPETDSDRLIMGLLHRLARRDGRSVGIDDIELYRLGGDAVSAGIRDDFQMEVVVLRMSVNKNLDGSIRPQPSYERVPIWPLSAALAP